MRVKMGAGRSPGRRLQKGLSLFRLASHSGFCDKTLAEKEVITQDYNADNMEAVQAGDRKIDGIIGIPGEHGLQGDL